MQKLGIIAGSGYLPVCMVKEAKAQGRIPIVVCWKLPKVDITNNGKI